MLDPQFLVHIMKCCHIKFKFTFISVTGYLKFVLYLLILSTRGSCSLVFEAVDAHLEADSRGQPVATLQSHHRETPQLSKKHLRSRKMCSETQSLLSLSSF